MKTLKNVQNLTFNDVKIDYLIKFPNDLCTIEFIHIKQLILNQPYKF